MSDPENDPTAICSLRRELDEARRECARLEEENARLRRLLGIPRERTPVSEVVGSPGLFADAPLLPQVDEDSPLKEKVALVRTLFRGREDVYAVLWVNERSGKKGYTPAIRGGWLDRRFGSTGLKDYLPLTDKVIEQHLCGQETIGVYPLCMNDTCWFLACDFDGKSGRSTISGRKVFPGVVDAGCSPSQMPSWGLDALGYLTVCERHGIPAYLERSRSGQGAHVWIFFRAPVPAVAARRLGTCLLRETMIERAELDLASYDRFFPSQDLLPKGGFGNLIALPLQKTCRELGNTEFVDERLRPWPDQWAFLSTVKLLSPPQVEGLLERLAPVEVGPGTWASAPRAPQRRHPAPASLACTVDASLSVEKAGLPSWLLAAIKHLASLHNPVFYERQKLRLSTRLIPRFVTCYEEDLSHIHLPRGLLEDLRAVTKDAGSRLVLTDLRPRPVDLSLSFRGTLTGTQEKIVASILDHDMGVLAAPPGAGKTVMACAIAARRNVPTLVLVHRRPLLEQWRECLSSFLGVSHQEIGELRSGKLRLSGVVDLAMLQSLKSRQDLKAFFSNYGLLIVDECHHLPAFTFESCVKQAAVRYVLGLTATPYRRDGLQGIITMQCGPIRQTIGPHQATAGTPLTLQLVRQETAFAFPASDEASIQQVFRALVHDAHRTDLISTDVLSALQEGRKCLILSQWKEHCQLLAERLSAEGKAPLVLDGSTGKKRRKAILGQVEAMPPDQELLLIATGQYLGEGFDCPQIDTLFLAFPISFKGNLVQYAGRLMRDLPGKRTVRVYDYADVQVPVLKRMQAKRQKTYEGLGFRSMEGIREKTASLWDE